MVAMVRHVDASSAYGGIRGTGPHCLGISVHPPKKSR